MNNNIEKNIIPIRKHMRLQGYDYSSPGAYFVTICTHNKQCLFGAIENGIMNLNPNGQIVWKCWEGTPRHYAGISNEIFMVMPNHIHGIIIIHDGNKRSGSKPDPTKKHPLSEIIRAFKSYSTRNINELRHTKGTVVWQHGYYEHVIRDGKDFQEIGEYILGNPSKWESDTDNPNISM
jgi:REP element-mobilizing transposase RayT